MQLAKNESQPVYPAGIFGCGAEHLFGRDAPQLGDILARIADEGAVTAGAAHRLRCHVGAVGLQHDAFQRQGADGFCRPLGTLEGTRPAKTDEQSLLCQPHRIVGTAGIAVDDALGLVFFQQGVNVGVGVAVVHDDGLVQFQRQLDVRLKHGQLAMFEAHIQLALELDKPIIVHDRNAHADVYALLKKYQPKGIVHCYSGSADDAVWLAKQGLFIGFGGACTFKGAKRAAKAISALPLESIVLETDCPYMAPEPVRGTRCDSSLIRYAGEYIAQLRGISAEEVFRTTAENARRVYGL